MASSQNRTDVAHLVDEHHAAVYRYAYRLSGSTADAEDLTQQTFMTAQRKLHQLADRARARGWLYAILRNGFLAACRKRAPQLATSMKLNLDHIPAASPTDGWVDREQLQQALNELAEEFRVVLLLFYFEECSYRDIAEQLGLPLGTVMSRISRAKAHLRRRLFADEAADSASKRRSPPTLMERTRG